MSKRVATVAALVVAGISGAGCRSGAAPVPAEPSAKVEVDASASTIADATAGADDDASGALGASVRAEAGDAGTSAEGGPSVARIGDGDGDHAGPPDMRLVPGGTFTMGAESGGEGDERPAHPVTLKPFWLDATEVTQTAYAACVEAKACPPADPAILATFQGLFKGPNKPVVGVSWFSAHAYCTWKGKRLPREAEYERAVRGDDGRRFPWGNDAPTHERTVFQTNAIEDVATHPSGRGPYGHDDLAGNVWEWLDDDYDPLAYSRAGAPEGKPGTCDEIVAAQNKLRAETKQGFTGSNPIPTECEKSIRGGAYNYPGPGLRSTNRIHHPPSFKLRMTGMRCAKDGG